MSADKRSGIADDAADYEDLPEPEETKAPQQRPTAPAKKAPPRGASGIASDADLFQDLLEESTDAVQRLDSDWLYQVNGQVFGPVKPKELLEMLYRAEITAETPVASEDGDFRPLRHFAVLRSHLPKVERHLEERAQHHKEERAESKKRLKKRLAWATAAIVLALVGSLGIAYAVRSRRLAAAEAEKVAKEQALKQELEDLLASVTIEPPLINVVEEPAPSKTRSRRARRRAKSRAVARFSGGNAGTGDLTRTEIMQGVGRAFKGFKRCIVQQMQRDKETVPEQIVLTFSVNNKGRAQNVSLTDRFLRRSPLKGCMATQLGKVRWRAYTGEVQNIEYPITIGRH